MSSASSIRLCFNALYLASSFAYSSRSCRQNRTHRLSLLASHIRDWGKILKQALRALRKELSQRAEPAIPAGRLHQPNHALCFADDYAAYLGEKLVVGASRCGEREARRRSTRSRDHRRDVWRAQRHHRCRRRCGSERCLRWH
jgi:hypothetical protein